MVYRQPAILPTHPVLDVSCRRCDMWGHEEIYFPGYDNNGVIDGAGPFCYHCFIKWRGKSRPRFGVIRAGGRSEWPVEFFKRNYYNPTYKIVNVFGERLPPNPEIINPPLLNTHDKPVSILDKFLIFLSKIWTSIATLKE